MESVTNLIELLKSQVALYSELRQLLLDEKEALVAWSFSDTTNLTKKKEALIHREHLLDEARKTLAARVQNEFGAPSETLSDLIGACNDPIHKSILISIRQELSDLVLSINAESLSLKMLYSTNIRLVNDFFNTIGHGNTNKYGMEKNSNSISSVHAIG